MLINAIKKEKTQLRKEGRKEGHKEGRKEGVTIGLKKGKTVQRKEIAWSMLQHGEPIEKIKQYTGLSISAIKKLKAA
jgi:predicted transposase YdaD